MQGTEYRRGGLRGLSDRYPRLWALPASMVMGVFMAAGFALNDNLRMAAFGVVIMTLFGLYSAFSKSEYTIAASGDGDERQRTIQLEASRVAYAITVYAALAGAMWELYAGRANEPASRALALICLVAAASYAAAFFFLKRRR